MTTSVTESKTGTMSEAEGRKEISPSEKGKTPSDASKVSSENTPKYTEAELKAAIHAAKSEAGRDKLAAETERDRYKVKLEAKEAELVDNVAENTAEIEKLQAKFDDMTSDDPAKFDVAKELKAAREERRQLKADRQSLEVEKADHSKQIKLATDTLREISIWEMAAEYEAGDPVKLKDLCDITTAISEEQIRKVADTLWTKKPTEPAATEFPLVTHLSGKTDGGGIDLSKLSPKELGNLAYSKKK